MSVLEIQKKKNSRGPVFVFKGSITDESQYDLELGIEDQKITFILEEIHLINSVGVQKWVKFMENLPPDVQLTFEKVSLRIVNQVNIFANFLGGRKAKFTSFYAPYYCEKCDDSRVELIDVSELNLKTVIIPPIKGCQVCQSRLEFDAVPTKYFSFLK